MARLAVSWPRTSLKSTKNCCDSRSRVAVGFDGLNAVAGVDEVNHIEQRFHGKDFHSADHGCFFGIGFRNDHAGNLAAPGFNRDGQSAANSANAAIKREFADEEAIVDFFSC